jgi:hypothetical protein
MNLSDIVWHKKLQDGDRNATHHKWYQCYGWAKGDTTVSPNDELVATLQDTAVDPIITECNNTGYGSSAKVTATLPLSVRNPLKLCSPPVRQKDLVAAGIAGIHMDHHLQEYLRPWLKHSEQYVPENNNTGVNLERLLSDDTDYGISIVE